MLGDFIITIISLILYGIQFLFSLINFIIPIQIQTAIANYINYLNYLQGIFPVLPNPAATGLWQTIGTMTIVGWFVTLLIALEILNVIIFLIRLIPFANINIETRHIINRDK